ncbi:MAG: malto-oligosyltrehalose trehalohydrolase, partial [Phormidesmis sp.]
EFTVWAPLLENVAVEIVSAAGSSPEAGLSVPLLPMEKDEKGYWHASAPDLPAGTRYKYQLEGGASWPDPASCFQPDGVHGPSEVVNHSQFDWQDGDWQGIPLTDYIIYEVHVGAFTSEGTFEAVIARLPDLVELGINVIEIMPVAQFPGARNWGYDGVFPFAVQNSYGGPTGLKRLVDACHQHGLAVIMDVVYNHFGPEGNYTGKFGPYTTDHYRTPWGSAINFDDAHSDGVRNYFIENTLMWLRDYHIDALRLDAVHAIYDFGAKHFLLALSEAAADFADSRPSPAYLIAESDLNDPRLIRPVEKGGYQLDAQWSDDFHHALHARLTGENIGYYGDFEGLEALAIALKNRFLYAGQYSRFRQRVHGAPALDLPSQKFVICNQNHDQVGNRMMGDRFPTLMSFEALKIAAGVTLLSPYLPLLFMGEEYGETAPFLYFVDHGDPDLIAAVRAGRKAEFEAFHSTGTPPDPAGVETLEKSTLNWLSPSEDASSERAQQAALRSFYRQLIEVRKQCKIATPSYPGDMVVEHTDDTICYHLQLTSGDLLCVMNFGEQPAKVELPLGTQTGTAQTWQQQINSADPQWSSEKSAAGTDNVLPQTITPETTLLSISPMSIALYRASPDT